MAAGAGESGQLKFPAGSQPVFQGSSTQKHPLGCRGEDAFGRVFRYAGNSSAATALVPGHWLQSAAQVDEHQAMTPSAAAIGDKSISVTPGAAAGAADLYAEGFAVIRVTPGIGYTYPVKTHLAITASTAFVVQLMPGWTIQVALTTDSRVSLFPNPYKNVIDGPASMTCSPAGVAVSPLAASEFGWIGVHGLFASAIEDTPAVGQCVGAPSDTAGQLKIFATTDPICGYIQETGVDDVACGVFWIL